MSLSTKPEDAQRTEVEDIIMQWRFQRSERLALEKTVTALKERETELKSWLMNVFKSQKMEGMIVDGRTTGLSAKEVHAVESKEDFIQYIYDNEAIELLQFRLSETAIKEHEDVAGADIPGLGTVEVYDLFDRQV
jgi:hypothetical protein